MSKKTVDFIEMLVTALHGLMDPVLSSYNEAFPQTGEDTGQERRTERSILYVLQNIANTCQHQLTGVMASGFHNAVERETWSLGQLAEIQKQYSGDDNGLISDPKYHDMINKWRLNRARVAAFEQIITAVSQVYADLSGAQLKPQVFKVKQAETVVAAALSAAQKKKVEALHAEVQAQLSQVAA